MLQPNICPSFLAVTVSFSKSLSNCLHLFPSTPCLFRDPFVPQIHQLLHANAYIHLTWMFMELKSLRTAAAIFLLLLFLANPCISRGVADVAGSEIYEIDYRGPETHTSIPPPGHQPWPWIHRESAKATSPKSKASRAHNNGEIAKEVRG